MDTLFSETASVLRPTHGILIANLCLRRGSLNSFYFTDADKEILSAVRSANNAQYSYDDSTSTYDSQHMA